MGIIEEVGSGVTLLKKGDRVVLPFNVADGRCLNCEEGNTAFCTGVNRGFAGGAFGYVSMGPYQGGQVRSTRSHLPPWSLCYVVTNHFLGNLGPVPPCPVRRLQCPFSFGHQTRILLCSPSRCLPHRLARRHPLGLQTRQNRRRLRGRARWSHGRLFRFSTGCLPCLRRRQGS